MGYSSFNIEELRRRVFSPGDIFWQKKSGKKVLLIERGSYLDFSHFEKYINFDLEIENQRNLFSEVSLSFKELEEAGSERERALIGDMIVSQFFKNFTMATEEDLVLLGEELFLDLPQSDLKILEKAKEDYLSRSSLCGVLSVVMALNLGYFGYNFLKDLYHVHFAISKKGGISSDKIIELEQYRTREILRLKENPFKEMSLALSYPFQSASIKNILYAAFEGEEGFGPEHIVAAELSELEMIISGTQKIVSFQKPFMEKMKLTYQFSKIRARMKNCG